MEKGARDSLPETEVLAMDEPRRPNIRAYMLFGAIFLVIAILIAANWGYISELAREDREKPAVTSIKTTTVGFTQKIKFTVKDDRNLPIKVLIRVHFWNTSDDNVDKSGWRVNYTEELRVPQGTSVTSALHDLPRGHLECPYAGWYVWVDATDFGGKNTTAERAVFIGQKDPDW